MSPAPSKSSTATIAENRRARFEYFIEKRFEAGLVLEGWEVKSLRAGRGQIGEGYAIIKNGAAWLLGSHIAPLLSASTHRPTDPERTRKLLLHRRELNELAGAVERRGFTLVPLRLYWKKGRAKIELGLVRGKKLHDKREVERERDWQRQRQRLLKTHTTRS